jgi:hypothetical protein
MANEIEDTDSITPRTLMRSSFSDLSDITEQYIKKALQLQYSEQAQPRASVEEEEHSSGGSGGLKLGKEESRVMEEDSGRFVRPAPKRTPKKYDYGFNDLEEETVLHGKAIYLFVC